MPPSSPRPQAGGAGGEGAFGSAGVSHRFSSEEIRWLEMIRDRIVANLGIGPDDFEDAPFAQEGVLGKVHQLFGDKLKAVINAFNETLAA